MKKIIPGYDCVAEVRKIREKLAAECGYDLDKIYKRAKTASFRFLESLNLNDND